jgi:uncharacterized protein YhaN
MENEMLVLLEQAYPGIRPDKINPELTEKYVEEAKHFHEIASEELQLASHKESVSKEKEKLENEINIITERLENIYKENDVGTKEEFLKTSEKYYKCNTVRKEIKRNKKELEALLEEEDLKDLEKELKKLRKEYESTKSNDELNAIDRDKAKSIADEIQNKINELEKQSSELKGRIETMEEDLEDRNILEVNLAKTQEERKSFNNYQKSLLIAMNQLEYVSQHMHKELAPILANSAGKIVDTITDNKYSTLKIDENLAIQLDTISSPFPVSVEDLSFGTKDQVYLALRLALTDFFSDSGEKLPVFLDDSFTQYDDKRAMAAMKTLKKVADTRQVFIFTCHNRDRENFVEVSEKSDDSLLLEL